MSDEPTPASAPPVLTKLDARGVAHLTMNRPKRHNAMDAALIDALADAAATLDADPAVRVIVLQGAGKSFSAGGDLAWMRRQAEADRATRIAEARRLAHMLGTLDGLSKPLIARVHGAAYGGGIGLMAVADTAIVAADAKLALTEVRLGLTPATISPYVVERLGRAGAREVFFSGRMIEPADAVRLRLASVMVAPEALDAAVEDQIAPYLAAAPGAVADAKRLVNRLAPGPDPQTIAMTIEALADRWETAEAREGIDAFFAKRAPSWRDDP
ncbi:MAG: crotonase/enoyl-CoA hydratase family protein [Pseudomonadota bacterium]